MVINFHKVNFSCKKLIKKIFTVAMIVTENHETDCQIDVSFVCEDEIQKLNNQHRSINKVTDVLSFPLLNISYPQKLEDFKEEIEPDGILRLGDIVICKQKAKAQAKEYGHSKQREIAFLALHGLLHLLGYDHIEKKDEVIMNSTCEKILSSLNIKRGKNV